MLDKRLMQEGKKVTGYLLGVVFLGIGIALLTVSQAGLVAQIISRVFLEDASLTQVKESLLFLLGIIGIRAILQSLSEMSAREAAIRVKEELRKRFLSQLITLGPIYTRGERAGELVNTAVEGIEALDEYFSRTIPQLVLSAFVPLLILFFVFPVDYKSGIILLVTGPLIPFFMILIGKLAEKRSLRQWQNLSRMSAHFLDMLQGLTTLKVFGRSRDQVKVIGRVSDSLREATMEVLRVAFLSALVLEFLATLSTALVAVTLGLRLINGTIPFAEALFLLLLAPEFYLPLRTLGTQFHARLSGVHAADRIYEVLEGGESENSVQNQTQIQVQNQVEVGEKQGVMISFERVSLCYDRGSEPVLTEISFTARPGQHIALVGPSGSGKSSILQMILRFIEPSAGEVRVKGICLTEIPLAKISREDWWTKLSYVSQKPYLFAGTIRDNLRIGRVSASFEEIVECAKRACAHEFILALPQGYDTVIGEGGARLSGGQAQRLALARAFLKGAPLLLLDEATSGLDTESEQKVQGALEEFMEGRTIIFAAHRLRTVEKADQILVLQQGQIVERGSHQELMDRHGLYTRLVREYGGRSQ